MILDSVPVREIGDLGILLVCVDDMSRYLFRTWSGLRIADGRLLFDVEKLNLGTPSGDGMMPSVTSE